MYFWVMCVEGFACSPELNVPVFCRFITSVVRHVL